MDLCISKSACCGDGKCDTRKGEPITTTMSRQEYDLPSGPTMLVIAVISLIIIGAVAYIHYHARVRTIRF